MADKKSFFSSIDKNVIPEEVFFKKILGYGMYEEEFLDRVLLKLVSLGREDVVESYKEWYQKHQGEQQGKVGTVSKRYVGKEVKQYEDKTNNQQREVVKNEWKKQSSWEKIAELLNYQLK